jgi:hypothetical protein
MTDRDDLAARLDDVEEDLADTSTDGFGSPVVYTDGDGGYETADGEPVDLDDVRDPDTFGTTIIVTGEYVPNDADAERGDV